MSFHNIDAVPKLEEGMKSMFYCDNQERNYLKMKQQQKMTDPILYFKVSFISNPTDVDGNQHLYRSARHHHIDAFMHVRRVLEENQALIKDKTLLYMVLNDINTRISHHEARNEHSYVMRPTNRVPYRLRYGARYEKNDPLLGITSERRYNLSKDDSVNSSENKNGFEASKCIEIDTEVLSSKGCPHKKNDCSFDFCGELMSKYLGLKCVHDLQSSLADVSELTEDCSRCTDDEDKISDINDSDLQRKNEILPRKVLKKTTKKDRVIGLLRKKLQTVKEENEDLKKRLDDISSYAIGRKETFNKNRILERAPEVKFIYNLIKDTYEEAFHDYDLLGADYVRREHVVVMLEEFKGLAKSTEKLRTQVVNYEQKIGKLTSELCIAFEEKHAHDLRYRKMDSQLREVKREKRVLINRIFDLEDQIVSMETFQNKLWDIGDLGSGFVLSPRTSDFSPDENNFSMNDGNITVRFR